MKTHLGHYEIISELGRGGMGVVYRAFEPALNRHVAIKELSPSLAHDPQLVERFLREARSMAALSDPHIIQIFYIGTDEATSQPFFAMEYVEGQSLSTLLKRDGKISVENTLKIIHQTAQGLATAHDRGVVHRDIKPGNLMVNERGQIKIADFGIALATQDINKKLTSTGEFVGTPGYLSPEVCLGKPIDQRSDIFSLGIVMFEMLSGHTPFSDESPLGLMLEVVKADIPDIKQLNDDVDAQTAAILTHMLAKEPEHRFQSCHDLVAALEAHALVARGGGIKLNTSATEAVTRVGTPPPVSQRPITPPPVVRSGVNTPTSGVSHDAPTLSRPSHAAPMQTQSKSKMWIPMSAAALLLIAVGAGAFAFRGPITEFARGFGDGFTGSMASTAAYDAGRSTGKASNPVSTSLAATSGMLDATSLEETSTEVTPALETPSTNFEEAAATHHALVETPVPTTPDNAAVASTEKPSNTSTAVTPAPTSKIATTDKSHVVAHAPKPAAPAPRIPRIAVITMGDSAITGPARTRVERQLAAAGFDMVDADALGIQTDDLGNALHALQSKATVAVVVRAEPIGSQQLSYYGRTDESYTAHLTIRAYDTKDRNTLSTGLSEKVQFTTLNADTQAQNALSGKLERLIAELAPYRRRNG